MLAWQGTGRCSHAWPNEYRGSVQQEEEKACLLVVFMVLTYLAPAPVRRAGGCAPG